MCDVNIISGELYHFSRDFNLPGPIPFVFERSYNSSTLRDSPLGWGWQLSLDVTVDCSAEETLVTWDDGTPISLPPLPIGQRIFDQLSGLSLRRDSTTLTMITTDLSEMYMVGTTVPGSYVLTARRDPFGNQVLFDRDYFTGRVRFVTDSCQRQVELKYDLNGHLTEVWLRAPSNILLLRFQYNSSGDLVAVIDRTEVPFVYHYDRHFLVSYTNRIGGSVYYQYDAQGKCINTWRNDRWFRAMRRDPRKKTVLLGDSVGNQSIIEHDENGNMVTTRDADGTVSENSYNPQGQLIYSSGILGTLAESHVFDAEKRILVSIVGNEQTEVHYDESDFPVKQIESDGQTSEYVYEKGLLHQYRSPTGARWAFDYDERGELNTLSMPNGRIIQRTVSTDWRTETLADNYGLIETLAYDDLGRIVTSENPGELRTAFQYGERNEITTAVLPDGSTVVYAYDAEGNLISEINELGQTTNYTFSPFGELLSTARAGGWRLNREYDVEGNMVRVTSPEGLVAQMDYNQRRQMVQLRNFDGREMYFSYDQQNRLVSCVHVPSGMETRYSYGGQSERVEYSGGTFIETEFDPKGNVLGITNESCSLKFQWDSEGHMVREQQGEAWLEYRYDPLGNVAATATSWGTTVSYLWDLRGRLISATLGDQAYQFAYNARNLLTSCIWPDGLNERFQYDAVDRLVGTSVRNQSDAELHRVSYSYDASDRLISVVRRDGVKWEFSYDALDRVISVHRNGIQVESYEYDLDGNLLKLRDGTQVVMESYGQIKLATNSRTVTYDNAGRLSEQRDRDRSFRYAYNSIGQLKSVVDGQGNLTEFGYDGLGRRIRKISSKGITNYLWTSLAPLAEQTSSETINYLFLPGSFFLKATSSSKPSSFVLDHLGSPIASFSGLEHNLVETERTLWGELKTPEPKTHPQVGRLGQYWDADIGLYYNWHRYYDPSLARYLQPDPLGISGGLNPYTYPDQPLKWIDPFGLYTCKIKKNDCWNDDQLKDAQKKLERLNEAIQQSIQSRSTGRRCFQTAAERWKYCKEKGRITKNRLKEKRRFRNPCKVQHIDHILEKQLKGGDECHNLQPLNAKVNMSFGSQIAHCLSTHVIRPSGFEFHQTETIPCKPGKEC